MSWWERQFKRFFDAGVNVSSVADGEILSYDSSAGEWVNGDLGTSATSYSPTYGAASGTWSQTSSVEEYMQIGNLAVVVIRSSATGNTSTSTAYLTVSLPVTPADYGGGEIVHATCCRLAVGGAERRGHVYIDNDPAEARIYNPDLSGFSGSVAIRADFTAIYITAV